MFQMTIFECSAEYRTYSSKFKVCMILTAELKIDPTARGQDECFRMQS